MTRLEPAKLYRSVKAKGFPVVALAYLAGVTLGEVLTTYADPRLGMATHCLLLLALVIQAGRTTNGQERPFLISMAFAPLIRILSLALPLTGFPLLYWYLIISVPLFVTLYAAAHAVGLSWRALGLHFRKPGLQGLIGLTGIVFGAVEYLILRPEPITGGLTWAELWWPALVLLISTGLLEEMIFRGLLQETGAASLGRWVLPYVGVLFAVLHIGYRSLIDLVFVLIVGTFFGWVVARTRSLVGVTLSHGLTNIFLFLVMPFVPLQLDAPQAALAWLASAIPQQTPQSTEGTLHQTEVAPQQTEGEPQSTEVPQRTEGEGEPRQTEEAQAVALEATPLPMGTPSPICTPLPTRTRAPTRTPRSPTPTRSPTSTRTPTSIPTAVPTPTPTQIPTQPAPATPTLPATPAPEQSSPTPEPLMPTEVPTATTTLEPTATVVCAGGPLTLDAYPLDRYNTPDGGWSALIYAGARGGDCVYTYAWNVESEVQGVDMTGPIVFEVHSTRRGTVILGTVLVTSAGVTVRVGVYVEPPA